MSLDRCRVMAIVNLTPDSFFDGGRFNAFDSFVQRVEQQIEQGADILDLGAASSKPGAEVVAVEEEWSRLEKPLRWLRQHHPHMPISIDTWRAEVAQRALAEGAHMINDISAAQLDPDLLQVVAKAQVPYVLMHMQGTPATMQQAPHYQNVVEEQLLWFAEKVALLKSLGLNDLLVDPGWGFGKTVEHNYQMLHSLERYHQFRLPLLVGVSRKSMICKVLQVNPEAALNGTSVLHTLALLKGAQLLRVHDVREARQAIALVETYLAAGNGTV